MSAVAMMLSVASGVGLLASGYLYGARRGREARHALEVELERRTTDRDEVQQNLEKIVAPLLQKNDTAALREMMSDVLRPMVERDRLGKDLSSVKDGNGLGELPQMLEAIAEKGGFSSVVLSDDAGLPLAANSKATSVDEIAGLASTLVSVVERAERANAPKPLAFVVLDSSNQNVLHRVFDVNAQRFTLTAVSRGAPLGPAALDAALGKIERVLGAPRS